MKKLLAFLIILMIFTGLIASIWFVIQISNPVRLDEGTVFEIKTGQGVNQISYNLKQQEIIRSQFIFEAYAFLKGVEHKFQAGMHELPSIINTKRLVEILTSGKSAEEWELTVIEGWTAREISQKLEDLGKFQSEELLEAIGQIPGNRLDFSAKGAVPASGWEFLKDKPDNLGLEGYLFPDTYRFFIDATIEDIVNKMLDNFNEKLTFEIREDINVQDKTIFEIIIMASIIEREVMSKDDMKTVSGIFWNRLNIGMALQADSTVNYITGKKTPAASLDDLEIDSLYNTYKYPGLPPGPISNPGINAIKAAIYPQETNYWYFLTDKNGKVHYAEDFDGHVRNKERYLR